MAHQMMSDDDYSQTSAPWAADAAEPAAVVVPMRGATAASPAPHAGASTPTKGEGGGKPAAKAKKAKTVDYGAVNGLMENFALIYGTKTAWDGRSYRVVSVESMRLAFGHDVVKMWLAMRDRRMIYPEDLVFEPGEDTEGSSKVNMWRGFGLEPVEATAGEVAPMLRLLRHLCSVTAETADECEQVVEWVLRWMALPLQKPGTKMESALVLHGPQGTGKNLFFDVWRDIFGDYGITVGQTEIEDKFNSWLSCKLAIVADEVVSRQEMYHKKNTLKTIVTTAKKFPIRAMMQETRWESNHANVVFLSNESQPLALEEGDRRYLVIYTPMADDTGIYADVRAFLDAGGLAKWLHYLQQYPLEAFDRYTKPPMTRAKEELIGLGLKPAQRFMAEWWGGFIGLPLRPCSGDQLYSAFRRWCDHDGERWPPSKAMFSRDAERWAAEKADKDAAGHGQGARLTYKVVQVQAHGSPDRKAKRCWVPRGTGPVGGETEGVWMHGCIADFEGHLATFKRGAGQGDDE